MEQCDQQRSRAFGRRSSDGAVVASDSEQPFDPRPAPYSYNPTYGYVLTNTLTLSDQIFMLPRQTNWVTRVNS